MVRLLAIVLAFWAIEAKAQYGAMMGAESSEQILHRNLRHQQEVFLQTRGELAVLQLEMLRRQTPVPLMNDIDIPQHLQRHVSGQSSAFAQCPKGRLRVVESRYLSLDPPIRANGRIEIIKSGQLVVKLAQEGCPVQTLSTLNFRFDQKGFAPQTWFLTADYLMTEQVSP